MRASLALLLLLVASSASGFWKAEYANDPERSQWFESLRDCQGNGCCGMADGQPYLADYTENADGSVTLASGERLTQCQVLRVPNRVGHAILFRNSVRVYCFVPGTGT